MLTHLHIQNYALIDALDIDLAAGFSVITGETGAGKSILLGALGLLLGQRADSKAIKPGAAKCCVEATFDISTLDLAGYFEENDLDYDPAACTVRREVLASGKSRSFVNDTPVNLQQLRALTSRLVDIHSQHKNLLINEEKFLLDLLDGAAANATLLTRYAEAYHDFTRTKREISQLNLQLQQARDEQDYLSFQASQLDEANLTEGEQEELEAEQQILTHAEEIKSRLYQVVTLLQEGEVNALEALRASQQHLDALGNVFADAAPLADRLQSTCIEVSDICAEAERHAERVEFDPERLAYVTDRLNLIYTLEQKHRVDSVGELLRIGRELNERLQAIQTSDERLAKLNRQLDEARSTLDAAAGELTARRREAGLQLADDLTRRLADLGMPSARLDFALEALDAPTPLGTDHVVLLFSANRNMPMQDVSDIASGGEIARLMLALKASTARHAALPTIIFDEIDTGVSGRMAEKMANTMEEMAAHEQIISITHLPQIAARGRAHYRVFKEEDERGTTSHIVRLTDEERVEEIARMLSGEALTDAAIRNAKELLAARKP